MAKHETSLVTVGYTLSRADEVPVLVAITADDPRYVTLTVGTVAVSVPVSEIREVAGFVLANTSAEDSDGI